MDGSSGLFLREGEELVGLTEEAYSAEDVLQSLLAKHPDLLPGEEIDPQDPRRFLLIKREAQVAGMQLDHLFIDQDGIPTFVETKRGSNTQVRREVVAQMLDYAANAAGEWDSAGLKAWLEDRASSEGRPAEELLTEFEPSFSSEAEFWSQVEQNLRDGKVRLLFVADRVPSQLQRIVEFLNERMTPTEVLAVEVRQFVADGKQLLSTNLVGQTEKARDIKGQARRRPLLDVLLEAGEVKDGQVFWLKKELLRKGRGDALSEDDRRLRFVLKVDGGAARVQYQPVEGGDTEELAASKARDRVRQELEPDFTQLRARAVYDMFSTEPGGPSLQDIAADRDLWE